MITERQWISSKILFTAISEQLAKDRRASFTITGMSMWPLLCHGRDQVIVEKVNAENLRKGDIILYRIADDRYILHRITRLKETCFQTTGDGNTFRDPWMPYDCVTARASGIVRNGRTIDCSRLRWKAVFRIWMLLFPVRKWMFAGWFHIRRYFRYE